MTFDDDFCQFEARGQMWRSTCKDLGFEWPPAFIIRDKSESMPGVTQWGRESMSQITDEQRAEMTHVARGALYVPAALQTETTHADE